MREIVISDWSKLGVTVSARRRQLGLSQVETAKRANVSRSWLARVEAGHRGAELEHTLRLLNVLGLTMVLGESPTRASREEQIGREITARHRERAEARRRAWSANSGDIDHEG